MCWYSSYFQLCFRDAPHPFGQSPSSGLQCMLTVHNQLLRKLHASQPTSSACFTAHVCIWLKHNEKRGRPLGIIPSNRTKTIEPNQPNWTLNQTPPTKPKLPKQTCQNKPTKLNLPKHIYQTKPRHSKSWYSCAVKILLLKVLRKKIRQKNWNVKKQV